MDLERATITLPAMTINGQKYEAQKLPIVARSSLASSRSIAKRE
jgi:hypothetical protein